MTTFVYGEDGLTLLVLENYLPQLLNTLGLNAPMVKAPAAFYRPSFGRAAGRSAANFGEFDFIIIYPDQTGGNNNFVFLGESKWNNANNLMLRSNQLFRFLIFRAYLTAWQSSQDPNIFWSILPNHLSSLNLNLPVNDLIPPPNSKLRDNIIFVLQNIPPDFTVKNLLLFFRINGQNTASPGLGFINITNSTGFSQFNIQVHSGSGQSIAFEIIQVEYQEEFNIL